MSQGPAMPVIVGAPRSGTTLLRFMLDSHPMLAIPPETGFLPCVYDLRQSGHETWRHLFDLVTSFPADVPTWPDFNLDAQQFKNALERIQPFNLAEGLRTFYKLYAARQNKSRYGDKTPTYCVHIHRIQELLPEAHFIHIIRDGRDASLSLRPLWFSPGRDIRTLASYWRHNVQVARTAGREVQAYMEVFYEDLVLQPERCLSKICSFLSLDYDPRMLRYWERTAKRLQEHKGRIRSDGTVVVSYEQRLRQQILTTLPPQPSRISRWKREMTGPEHAEFLQFAGDTLEDLGYEV